MQQERLIVREPVRDEINCRHVADAPIAEKPRAENATDALVEESGLAGVAETLATQLGALWKCLGEYNDAPKH